MNKTKLAKRKKKTTQARNKPATPSQTLFLRNLLFGFLGLGIMLMMLSHFNTSGEPESNWESDTYLVSIPTDTQETAQNSVANGQTDYNMKTPKAVALVETTNPQLEENTEVNGQDKASSSLAAAPTSKWHEITLKEGDNLTNIFKRYRLGHFTLKQITQLPHAQKITRLLQPGNTLSLLIDDAGQLQKLRYEVNQDETLIIEKNNGLFTSQMQFSDFNEEIAIAHGKVYKQLRTTLRRAHVSDKQWLAFANVFSGAIDFRRDLRVGDRFEFIYKKYRFKDNSIRSGDIIAAKLIQNKKTTTAIYYKPDNAKQGHYYTPTGESLQKSFIRTPVKYTRISSPFDLNRYHPILKVKRPHEGVDLAAPRGTPVLAAADGRVKEAGTRGGYGKFIELDHGRGITTRYGHLSRISKRTKVGHTLQKGQVIGYVGSTGLATGPHLHYEYRLNGKPKNPMQVKLPKGRQVADMHKQRFNEQATRVLAQFDQLERGTTTVVAQR